MRLALVSSFTQQPRKINRPVVFGQQQKFRSIKPNGRKFLDLQRGSSGGVRRI
jgi:hypothetical protein